MAWRRAATEQLSKATQTIPVTPHQRFDRAAASRCPARTAAAPWLALLAAKVTPKQQGDTNVPWPCRCPGPTASTPAPQTPHPRFVLGQSLVARSRCDLGAAAGAEHHVGLGATSPAPVIKCRRGSPASSGGCSWAGFTLQGFGLFAGMGRLGAGGGKGVTAPLNQPQQHGEAPGTAAAPARP